MTNLLKNIILLCITITNIKGVIIPPPWADPLSNPCALQPRGWQLLYWPPDGKCYKIFQIGAPCPETMELGPAAGGSGTIAECRCPPGTAQSPRDALCYPIFTRSSCPRGQYFAPVPETHAKTSLNSKRRWGICREPETCSRIGDVYWPRDNKCYPKLTKGPCPRGELLILGEDGLAKCSCSMTGELGRYYWPGSVGGCHEHYTKGPCTEPGELFLPGGVCGCHPKLPHYHESTGMCYQLGSIGPCPKGHQFVVDAMDTHHQEDNVIRAKCKCKSNHVLYQDGLCYRLYTKGPCENGYMITNTSTCVPIPCRRRRLYFPEENTCYKIGTKGPCPNGQVVSYDYTVRPSIDGISYNGLCGCTNDFKNTDKCSTNDDDDDNNNNNNSCENIPGMVLINTKCYKLYTQGPCTAGEWLVARRIPKNELWVNESQSKAICECRPGYKRITENLDASEIESSNVVSSGECQPPTVTLARLLNSKHQNDQSLNI